MLKMNGFEYLISISYERNVYKGSSSIIRYKVYKRYINWYLIYPHNVFEFNNTTVWKINALCTVHGTILTTNEILKIN